MDNNEKVTLSEKITEALKSFLYLIFRALIRFFTLPFFVKIGKVLAWPFVKVWPYLKWFLLKVSSPFRLLYRKTYKRLTFQGKKVVWSFIFLSPVLIGFMLFFIYPLIMSSIYTISQFRPLPAGGYDLVLGQFIIPKRDIVASINIFRQVIDLEEGQVLVKDLFYNFKNALFINRDFPVALVNTVKNTAIDVFVITIFSLLVAVMLNGNFKGRGIVRAIFFLPVIFNSEAINQALTKHQQVDAVLNQMGSGALTAIFNLEMFLLNAGIPNGLITFLTGITTAIYRTISYSGIQILIFLAAIQSVPNHLYEAATIEGATKYESFWKITLPMVSPMILTVVVFTVVDSFMRSDINGIISTTFSQSNYGLNAAMNWLYMGASILLLVIFIGILSKVVFYYDE